jgi:WD40 repeat protein
LGSGSWDETIRLWDVATGEEMARLEGHKDQVRSLAISPDGKTLASACTNGTIKLWDLATTQEQFTLGVLSTERQWCVVFSPDGKTLASASDKRIKLWDVSPLTKPMP